MALSLSSLAQSYQESAAELNSTPPVLTSVEEREVSTKPTEIPVSLIKRKVSYGLSAGTQFSRYGTTSFLEPSVIFPVTRRFSGYASLSFVNSFGPNYGFYNSELPGGKSTFTNQRYILNAGGNYMVNERLNLTGSVWRDLSKNQMPAAINLYYPGGTSGVSMRANYKITQNLSVSGGFRVSKGNSFNSFNNFGFHPATPFGY